MALVNVVSMVVLDNPTCFSNPFQFEITFECLQELEDDLEWKVLYVGSAHDSHQDQVLDEILVGPVPVGLNKFVLQADPPSIDQLPPEEVLGVTVILVTCSYKEREFVRVGYYVNNEYIDPDAPAPPPAPAAAAAAEGEEDAATVPTDGSAAPPPPLPTVFEPGMDVRKVQRQILADKPRVTKFPIPWGGTTAAAADENENTDNNNNNDGMDLSPQKPAPSSGDAHHQSTEMQVE